MEPVIIFEDLSGCNCDGGYRIAEIHLPNEMIRNWLGSLKIGHYKNKKQIEALAESGWNIILVEPDEGEGK